MAEFGDPRLPPRFWAKVEIIVGQGCWLWTANKAHGYGRFRIGKVGGDGEHRRRKARAHRLSYETLVAPLSPGLMPDHLCRVRRCVNPDHMEPVTNRENLLRGNTLNAKNASKTHCSRGHEFDAANTYRDKQGKRHCRTCHRNRSRAAYQGPPPTERFDPFSPEAVYGPGAMVPTEKARDDGD